MATNMNSHNLWSNTNIKDVLVPYEEGLACDNFGLIIIGTLDHKQLPPVH